MRTLKLADGLALPLEFITLRVALFGTSGSGKTTFARLLAEQVHAAGHRFCAIDLKNDWWGLKASADGTGPGLPVVVFGGPRADVQLPETAGALVADTIAGIDQSTILDLDAFSKGKQLRFLAQFLERLYDVNRQPLLLLADEADRYASQKPMSPEATIALGASEDIARRGRKRGVGSVWLTQRTAVLNKNVSDLCDLTVVFRTPGARDLDELEERVGRLATREQVREVMRAAPALEDGQAIFLSTHPKLRGHLPDTVRPIQMPMPWTFDSSASPGLRTRAREPKVLAQTDLVAIEAKMAATIAQAKADDPRALRTTIAEKDRRIKELERATPGSGHSVPTATGAAKINTPKAVEILTDADRELLRAVATRLTALPHELDGAVRARLAHILGQAIEKATAAVDKLAAQRRQEFAELLDKKSLARILEKLDRVSASPAPGSRVSGLDLRVSPSTNPGLTRPGPTRDAVVAVARQVVSNGAGDASVGKSGLRRMLIALAQRPQGLTRGQLGLRARVSAKGGSFDTYLSKARVSGWVISEGDRVTITDAGVAALGTYEPLPSGRALLEHYIAEFGSSGAARMLRAIADVYPGVIGRSDLAVAASVSDRGGSFDTYLSKLRTLELVEGSRELRASDELFLEA